MVFISHRTESDHGYALEIAKRLTESGVSCWIAPESIPEGTDFVEELVKAINCCEIFVLVLTKDTRLSQHVRMELKFAFDHHKKIMPLKIGDFVLDDNLTYMLNNVQYVPFDLSDDAFSKLIEKCRLGEPIVHMEISKWPRRELMLMKGDVQANMSYIIDNMPDRLPNTVFALGLDCSSDISVSTTVGMVKAVCDLLRERYGITSALWQDLIDKAKIEQLGHPDAHREMQYGDSILIRIPIRIGEREESFLQLLLIANSRKKNPDGNIDDVVGIDSRKIIMSVFDRCDKLGDIAENLFIGAMGTNGLGFPYEVITAEILNCYIFAMRRSEDTGRLRAPMNLFYSVRQIDMERSGISSDEVISYISMVIGFFKK